MCQCHQLPAVRDQKRTPQHLSWSTPQPRAKAETSTQPEPGLSRWRRLKRLIFGALSAVLVGCSSSAAGKTDHAPAMASLAMMPDAVRSSAAVTQEAYQFAVANPEILKEIPCYCGCGSMGHTSNYSCYVRSVSKTAVIAFDTHALGCSICVDIAQDAMRFARQGKSLAEIQSYVHDTYARFGPSNM